MKHVLIPFDFSAQAKAALDTALSFLGTDGGRIDILHVIELPVLQDPMLMPVPSFETGFLGDFELKARAEFKKIDVNVPENIRISFEIKYGSISRQILDYASESKTELIIMGTHGASGMREVFVGSNTEKIVRGARVPVLAVRNAIKKDQIKNIVFPNMLDTENQEKLVSEVKALQNFFQATLHIVRINTPANFSSDKKSREKMVTFIKRFMIKDYTINIYNDISEEIGIANFATDNKLDLIAMGTHGRKGLAHMIVGSVTEDVLNHIELPIWTTLVI